MNTQVMAESIELIEVKKLIPNPKNNNRHSIEQVERLSKLIKHNGFRVPIIVSKKSGHIVSGHARLMAAIKIGMEKVPVIYQDFSSEVEEYQFLTADNEIARWAELDLHAMAIELKDLDLGDFELLGLEKNPFTVDDNNLEQDEFHELDPQFIVSVHLNNENDQSKLFERLKLEGYECKLIS